MAVEFYGLMLKELEEANDKISLLADWIYLKAEKANDSIMNGAVDLVQSAPSLLANVEG